MEHPDYWWNARVVSVEHASQIPAGVDRSCVPAPALAAAFATPAGPASDLPIIVVTYHVGKAAVSKAYVESKGARWETGDAALVHPDSCRIKRGNTRASADAAPGHT